MKWFMTSSIIALLCVLDYVNGTPTWTLGPTGKYYIDLRQPNKNKEESAQLCEDAGGFLPQPMNRAENDFLKRFNGSTTFYLGLHDSFDEGVWMWDTCPVRVEWLAWIHWSSGIEPDGGVEENCALFSRKGKGWVDIECTYQAKTVVCERHIHSWIQGPNAKQYMEMCIPDSNKEKTTQICKDAGGILPQPMNNEENDFVKSLFTREIFLGMNDIENETRFVWDDGGALVQWFGWDDRIPQPTGHGDCVMTGGRYGWFDIMCTWGVTTVVCERQDRTEDCLRPYFCENNQKLCFKCKKGKKEGKCLLLKMEGTLNKPLSYPVHYSDAIDPEVGGFSCSMEIPVKDIVNASTMPQPQRLKFTMKISESNTSNVLFPMDYVIGSVTDFTSTSTKIHRLGTNEKMRCSVKHRQNVANVTSIAISNNGVKVAKITQNDSASSVGNSNVLNVTGSLTSTLEELGFLELTLTDSGNYTCDIKVKDKLGKTTYINRVLNIDRVAETNSDIVDYLLKQKNLQSHGNTPDVFFSVGLSKPNNKRIPSGQVLIFNQIFSSMGGSYDTATGVFTCPVAGFYNFIVHAQTEYSEEVAFHVQHNGRNVFDVSSRDGYAYQDVSNSAILKLKKGDTVRVVSYDDETEIHSTVESVTTTFSGHLISVV